MWRRLWHTYDLFFIFHFVFWSYIYIAFPFELSSRALSAATLMPKGVATGVFSPPAQASNVRSLPAFVL